MRMHIRIDICIDMCMFMSMPVIIFKSYRENTYNFSRIRHIGLRLTWKDSLKDFQEAMMLQKYLTRENLEKLVEKMDDHIWFRMLICVLPGLIINRTALLLDLPDLIQAGTTIIIFIGFAIFVLWKKIREKMQSEDEDEENEDTESGLHHQMIESMKRIFRGNMNRVHSLIDEEYQIRGDGDYLKAIESAYRRVQRAAARHSRKRSRHAG